MLLLLHGRAPPRPLLTAAAATVVNNQISTVGVASPHWVIELARTVVIVLLVLVLVLVLVVVVRCALRRVHAGALLPCISAAVTTCACDQTQTCVIDATANRKAANQPVSCCVATVSGIL